MGARTPPPSSTDHHWRLVGQIYHSSEVGKLLHSILGMCPDFVPEGFTPHGCKATTLVMLRKYGASPDDRLILGHHQVNKGALEVYSSDLQSAPLRVLEQMMKDIRQRNIFS